MSDINKTQKDNTDNADNTDNKNASTESISNNSGKNTDSVILEVDNTLKEQLKQAGVDDVDNIFEETVKKFISNYGCPNQKNPHIIIEASELEEGVHSSVDPTAGKILINLEEIIKSLDEEQVPVNPENLVDVIKKIIAHLMGSICFHKPELIPDDKQRMDILLDKILNAGGRILFAYIDDEKTSDKQTEDKQKAPVPNMVFYPNGLDLIEIPINDESESRVKVHFRPHIHKGFAEYLSKKLYGENPISFEYYTRAAMIFEKLEEKGRFNVQKVAEFHSMDHINLVFHIIADILGIQLDELTGENVYWFILVMNGFVVGSIKDIDRTIELLLGVRDINSN